MTRSYIQPKSKQILSDEMQLVILFFTISIAMLFLTYGFLKLKIYTFEESITRIETKKVELKNSTQKMQHQIQIVEQESDRAEKVVTENSVLKESVKNLFDLVPDRIILTEVELNKNSLVIFNNTYTSFYQADNGWLSFVSTNTLDDEELLQ